MKVMQVKMMLLAGALCLSAWTGVRADDPSAGVLYFDDGSELELTNVLGNAVCLKQADLSAFPSAKLYKILFDTARPTPWGSSTIKIDTIDLSLSTNLLVTVANDAIVLESVGTNSMFHLTQSSACTCTVQNVCFQGAGQGLDDFAPYDGGALHLEGGALTLEGCTFTNFVTRFTGGAVSAICMHDDVFITNCAFACNTSHPINGNGGALYVSAVDAATCRIVDCAFNGNMAENGGAISTWPVVYDTELPINLDIIGSDAMSFIDNVAEYEGGAIIAEGAVSITNAVFSSNSAGLMGGALCMTGIENDTVPTISSIMSTTFADNAVEADGTGWVAGGAIAVMVPGNTLMLDEYVVFTNNTASAPQNTLALGGAIYAHHGVTNDFHRAYFVDNVAGAGTAWSYGDAIAVEQANLKVDTCLFDCASNVTTKTFGNAIDAYASETFLLNSTFRRGKVEAVSIEEGGALAMTNCVVVGNALSESKDLYVDGDVSLSVDYSAYGHIYMGEDVSAVLGAHNLTNLLADTVYAGESLRLDETKFNSVAALGLSQTNRSDYLKVAYGSKSYGSSMGAYETPTPKMTVSLDGSRAYDRTTSSNGCVWVWDSYTPTNMTDSTLFAYTWDKDNFGSLPSAFAITSWSFSSAEGNYYASTNAVNTITASVTSRTDRVEWLAPYVNFVYTGTIEKNTNDVIMVFLTPSEYEWTGSEVVPGSSSTPSGSFVVSNTTAGIEIPTSEYTFYWTNNVGPTASAKLTVKGTNNYDFTQVETFSITAYETKFMTNDVVVSVYTNGALSATTARVDFAMAPSFPGYCLDYQNSTTNKTVELYDATASEPNTTVFARYAVDANSDAVPDKYQKKIIVAVVNGDWNAASNATDRIAYVTMTNGVYTKEDGTTEGVWSQNSSAVCTLDSALLPAVGERPLLTFTTGTWKAADGTDAFAKVMTWSSFPIFYYEYGRSSGRSGSDKKSMNAILSATSANGFVPTLLITDFAMDDAGEIGGAVEAQILDAATGAKIWQSMELAHSKIEILGAETLDGQWFKVGEATTDENGVWVLSRMRAARTLTAVRTTSTDRSSSWDLSSAGQPKFFKLQLVEE